MSYSSLTAQQGGHMVSNLNEALSAPLRTAPHTFHENAKQSLRYNSNLIAFTHEKMSFLSYNVVDVYFNNTYVTCGFLQIRAIYGG